MADRTIPESVAAIFAAITGTFEDAAAMAAAAQGSQNRVEALQAIHQVRHMLCRIERQLAKLEAGLE